MKSPTNQYVSTMLLSNANTSVDLSGCFEITKDDTSVYNLREFVSEPRAGNHYIRHYLALASKVGYKVKCKYDYGTVLSISSYAAPAVLHMPTDETSQTMKVWANTISERGEAYTRSALGMLYTTETFNSVCDTCGVPVGSIDTRRVGISFLSATGTVHSVLKTLRVNLLFFFCFL
jgi:hypothetical protein